MSERDRKHAARSESSRWRRWSTVTAPALGLLTAACTTAAASALMASGNPAPIRAGEIRPMTHVVEQPREGYFSDPYPVHLAPSGAASIPQSFSGTTREILSCPAGIAAGCSAGKPVTVTVRSGLAQAARAHRSVLTREFNSNIYQENSGAWEMAATFHVENPRYPGAATWTVIVHASPASVPAHGIPVRWVADSLLVGSFAHPTKADYDGKYFANSGHLYLIYSKRLSDQPAEDGLVAQLMTTASRPSGTAPTVLIAPGGYNSEYFFGLHQPDKFKLVETGNVTEIDGKYVLAYSTGAYNEPDYKIGVAWSDTFLPRSGSYYRKILRQDVTGIRGQPHHQEVQYLLQSQEPAWPDYAARYVLAPGVPSLVRDKGQWYLCFAGYLPSNAPVLRATGHFDPSDRRPFFMRLNVRVPAHAMIAATSDTALAGWITPAR